MIDKIDTVIMDLNGLKNNDEIKSYIPTQLIKYHPKPDMLIFDYVITGKTDNKTGLVSYIDKKHLDNNDIKTLTHPLLLFKYQLKKDGKYLIFYGSNILEIEIVMGSIFSSNQLKFSYDYIEAIVLDDQIIISDDSNKNKLEKIFGSVISLESLYKKCKKDLFTEKKRKVIKPLTIVILPVLIILMIFIKIHISYQDRINRLSELEKKYSVLKSESNQAKNNIQKYNELLNELYIIKSQQNIDLYSMFYNLNSYADNFKITDLYYSNRFLRVNAISTNSIKLVKDLNSYENFNFIQHSTTTNFSYEAVNFSGELLCP